jgi:hypothetical protein
MSAAARAACPSWLLLAAALGSTTALAADAPDTQQATPSHSPDTLEVLLNRRQHRSPAPGALDVNPQFAAPTTALSATQPPIAQAPVETQGAVPAAPNSVMRDVGVSATASNPATPTRQGAAVALGRDQPAVSNAASPAADVQSPQH